MFCWPKNSEVALMEEGKMYGKIFGMVEAGNLDFDEFQEHVSNHQDFSNKRYKFWTQAFLSGGLVVFSASMLAINGIDAAYMSLISGILGYWLPTPLSDATGYNKPRIVQNEVREQKKKVTGLLKENGELKAKIQPRHAPEIVTEV